LTSILIDCEITVPYKRSESIVVDLKGPETFCRIWLRKRKFVKVKEYPDPKLWIKIEPDRIRLGKTKVDTTLISEI
jgi:hypothetical protein